MTQTSPTPFNNSRTTLEELAFKLKKAEAGRDLLARLAEEASENLATANLRIARLVTENLMMRAHSTCRLVPIEDLEGEGEGEDDHGK